MDRVYILLLLGFACLVPGCAPGPGTEKAARNFLNSEFRKWQAGEKSQATTIDAVLAEPPISYEFYSVTPTAPSLLAFTDRTAPAFQIKVKTTWVSQAKTELTKSNTYVLTWLAGEKKWHVEK